MNCNFTDFNIVASCETSLKAAKIFADEAFKRFGRKPEILTEKNRKCVELKIENAGESEAFEIVHTDDGITITAHRMRALLFGVGMFFRKTVFENGEIIFIKNISGSYEPGMKTRGHQLSYTDMNNTYDAWTKEQFRQYLIDLSFFGNNMFESDSGGKGEENRLMHYTRREAMRLNSIICDEIDIDHSVWHPLSKDKTDEETMEELRETYGQLVKLNVLFPPGGDPGDMQAEDFIDRCIRMKRELKKYFPEAKMYPSAQAPHCYPDWGERFAKKMAELPEEIDGIIYGPNHAMPLDELRRRIDKRYPIRFYPDITHNVRCEYPVHFTQDDWHFAYTSTLSRESVNPRPFEYRLLHKMTEKYVEGSVSYSEGCHDDLNKFVWSALDFDPDADLREIVEDYARTFFTGADIKKIADGIFALEQNWACDPAESSTVEYAYGIFTQLEEDYPFLKENWRFLIHLFRACCDKVVRDRRINENLLVDEAEKLLRENKADEARDLLKNYENKEYETLRARLFTLAEKLFELIGIQLDVEHFGGMAWERGCTLMTIDNPVSDRYWVLDRIESGLFDGNYAEIFERNKVDSDEFYFSFALHGFDICGKQEGEFYMDFQGDGNFDRKLPMCMTKLYDHFNFRTKVTGLTGGDYKLRITYKDKIIDKIDHHRVAVSGKVIHDGAQFGGVRDTEFEKKFLTKGYQSVVYDVPAECFINGCAELEITELLDGFEISEFWFIKA